MKQKLKRMLALFLALSMTLALFGVQGMKSEAATTYLTRAQAVKIINAALGITSYSKSKMSAVKDVKKSSSYYVTMARAVSAGLISPNAKGKLKPTAKATYKYVARILAKAKKTTASKMLGSYKGSKKLTKAKLKKFMYNRWPEIMVPTLSVDSQLYGEAFTNGYTTLKKELGVEVTYDQTKPAVMSLAFAKGTKVKNSLIDTSKAKVKLVAGDGYYTDELVFNGTKLTGSFKNGSYSYYLKTGDIEWAQPAGYTVANGGKEWSAQGGNGNGEYVFNLSVSGIRYDGMTIPAATFQAKVYIYGREFTSSASPQNPGGSRWGAGGYDDVELPLPAEKALEQKVSVGSSPVFTWVGSGKYDIPVICDYSTSNYSELTKQGTNLSEKKITYDATDNFYISWPSGTDASAITDKDVTITLTSEYGDSYVLTPNTKSDGKIVGKQITNAKGETETIADGDYSVFASKDTTQIAVNMVYWAYAPVYSKMKIAAKVNGKKYTKTYSIGSVYTYLVQTGGGLDYDGTVTMQNMYGIANLSGLTFADVTGTNQADTTDISKYNYVYAYGVSTGHGPQKDYKAWLAEKDGDYAVVADKASATVYKDDRKGDFIGNAVLYTNTSGGKLNTSDFSVASGAINKEYEGETVSFEKAYTGQYGVANSVSNAKALPGFVLSENMSMGDHMRWPWLTFIGAGWLEEKKPDSEQPADHSGDTESLSANKWVYITEVESSAPGNGGNVEKDSTSNVSTGKVAVHPCYALKNVVYCSNPADASVQVMDIYVPEEYVTAVANGDGTYDCKVNASGSFARGNVTYTAETAPIIYQNTIDGYKEGTTFSLADSRRGGPGTFGDYLASGYVTVSIGTRGSSSTGTDGTAPAAIVDLKAGVRYLKANDSVLPGDSNKIFATGASAGGALTATLGASGNSALYDKYLKEIGAADATDDIYGALVFCPIANLELGDAAFEYLHKSETSGSIGWGNNAKNVVFTDFQSALHDQLIADFEAYLKEIGYTDSSTFEKEFEEAINDSINYYVANELDSGSIDTFASGDGAALVRSGNTFSVKDVDTFVTSYMARKKMIPAFDSLDKSSTEAALFDQQHFSKNTLAALEALSDKYGSETAEYISAYKADLTEQRLEEVKLMSALTFLGGSEKSTIAPYWRFRNGTKDGDLGCIMGFLMNEMLAKKGISTEYSLIWGLGHCAADYNYSDVESYVDKAVSGVSADDLFQQARKAYSEGNYATALPLFEQLIGLGDARGYEMLAGMYQEGKGVEKDIQKAIEYNEKAAELGSGRGYTNIGLMYYNGTDVEKDHKKALSYFIKSTETSNPDFKGPRYAGLMYEDGDEVEQDYGKAAEYYQKAADGGDITGNYLLGHLYEKGLGVEQSYDKAIRYYEVSASPDNAQASYAVYALGHLYEEGLGVEKNLEKAKEYYVRAAGYGHSGAITKLSQLGEDVSNYKVNPEVDVEHTQK